MFEGRKLYELTLEGIPVLSALTEVDEGELVLALADGHLLVVSSEAPLRYATGDWRDECIPWSLPSGWLHERSTDVTETTTASDNGSVSIIVAEPEEAEPASSTDTVIVDEDGQTTPTEKAKPGVRRGPVSKDAPRPVKRGPSEKGKGKGPK